MNLKEFRLAVRRDFHFWRAMWKARRHVWSIFKVSRGQLDTQTLRNLAIGLRRAANGDAEMLRIALEIEQRLALAE